MPAIPAAKTLIQKETSLSAGAGTIETTGTAVTGTTTSFLSEAAIGGTLVVGTEARIIVAIASDTALTLLNGFANDLPASTAYQLPTYLNVPGASDLTGPQQQNSQVDVSDFDATGFAKQISGLTQPGSLDFTLFFEPRQAVHRELQANLEDKLNRSWRIWIPDSPTGLAPPDASNSILGLFGSMNQLSFSAATDGAWQSQASVLLFGAPAIIEGT